MLQSLSGQLGDKSLAPVGIHCILELYGCPPSLLDNPLFVKKSLQEAAKQAKSTLLNEVLHEFEPQGITALVLLAESHISIHTWPEQGYAAVDVFTCGKHTEPEQACAYLAQRFQAREQSLCKLPRKLPIAAADSMTHTERTIPTQQS